MCILECLACLEVTLHIPLKKDKYRRKAKVVAAAWGTEFIQFLATLAVLH